MKKIKRISLLKNVVMCDNKGEKTFNDKGVILVEYKDNTRHVLDLESKQDITNKKDINVGLIKGGLCKSKIKDIFNSEN